MSRHLAVSSPPDLAGTYVHVGTLKVVTVTIIAIAFQNFGGPQPAIPQFFQGSEIVQFRNRIIPIPQVANCGLKLRNSHL
jgi:hypothetical protein